MTDPLGLSNDAWWFADGAAIAEDVGGEVTGDPTVPPNLPAMAERLCRFDRPGMVTLDVVFDLGIACDVR